MKYRVFLVIFCFNIFFSWSVLFAEEESHLQDFFLTVYSQQKLFTLAEYQKLIEGEVVNKPTGALVHKKKSFNLIELVAIKGKEYAHVQVQDTGEEGWAPYDSLFYASKEEHKITYSCLDSDKNKVHIEKIGEALEAKRAATLMHQYTLPDGPFNKNCSDFIKKNGQLGEKGRLLKKEIIGDGQSKNNREYLLDKPIRKMDDICPQFNDFSEEEKIRFWIWTFASIAQVESSCSETVVNFSATDGVAAGYFQLNERTSLRISEGAGCNAKHSRKRWGTGTFYMSNFKNSIPCAVEIMSGDICGKHVYSYEMEYPIKCKENEASGFQLFGKHMYWQELRGRSNNKITRLIRTLPLCQQKK